LTKRGIRYRSQTGQKEEKEAQRRKEGKMNI
jgi:hypothetical protein